MAQISIIQKSECSKYDFGYSLLSPDFFLADKLNAWNSLGKNSKYSVNDCFFHIKDTENRIDKEVACYDLTHALSKFINNGDKTNNIGSSKKIAIKDDFIISRLRYYLEEMGIVEKSKLQQLFSTEFLVFRAKTKNISACALFALCMTNAVQTILKRSQYGTEHPRFYDFVLENLPIPNFLFDMNKEIEKTVKSAHQKQAQAKELYAQAENLLLTELGLLDYQPKQQLSFSTTKAEIKQAQRFDAEYFQPKALQLRKIFENENSVKIDNSITTPLASGSTPKSGGDGYEENGKIKFIRAVNLSGLEINYDNVLYIKKETHNKMLKRSKLQTSDVLFSIAGVIGRCAVVCDNIGQANINQALAIIRLDKERFNPYYVALFFNSKYGNQYVNDISRPVAQTNLNLMELSNIHVPLLPLAIQNQIAEKIIKSHTLRKQSKELLELAKTKVEQAIENPTIN